MSGQLPLRIGTRDSIGFDNFYPGLNAEAVAALRADHEACIYLWGPPGSGKTHLLLAACRVAGEEGRRVSYLDLEHTPGLKAGILEGLETLDLVCVDGIDAVAGQRPWETGLFHLYNRARRTGAKLRVAGAAGPRELGLKLPDLVSRLGWGPIYHLYGLDDEGKLRALSLHARARGLALSDEVGRYLLRRFSRREAALFGAVQTLDNASLAAQRRLTIPFVKQVLGL
jgi:DnaA family protein